MTRNGRKVSRESDVRGGIGASAGKKGGLNWTLKKTNSYTYTIHGAANHSTTSWLVAWWITEFTSTCRMLKRGNNNRDITPPVIEPNDGYKHYQISVGGISLTANQLSRMMDCMRRQMLFIRYLNLILMRKIMLIYVYSVN